MTVRRIAALLTCGVVFALGGAGPAAAKSDLSLSAVAAAGARAEPDRITLTAVGGDDAAGPQRLCVQQDSARGWRDLACGRVRFGMGGKLRVVVPVARTRAGTRRFRAELERVPERRKRGCRCGGQPSRIDRVSAVVTVPVPVGMSRGPWETAALSAAAVSAPAGGRQIAASVAASVAAGSRATASGAGSAAPAAAASCAASPLSKATVGPGAGAGYSRQRPWRSTVSLSTTDTGTLTASLVRSK